MFFGATYYLSADHDIGIATYTHIDATWTKQPAGVNGTTTGTTESDPFGQFQADLLRQMFLVIGYVHFRLELHQLQMEALLGLSYKKIGVEQDQQPEVFLVIEDMVQLHQTNQEAVVQE